MTTINIDTLKVQGTGSISLTEGDSNTPIKEFEELCGTNANIRALHMGLSSPNPKLTGELKRILMLLHLTRTGEVKSDDVWFYRDFSKNSYAKFHGYHTAFSVLLGLKNETVAIRTATFSNNIIQDHLIDNYLEEQKKGIEILRKRIMVVNQSIREVFNQI